MKDISSPVDVEALGEIYRLVERLAEAVREGPTPNHVRAAMIVLENCAANISYHLDVMRRDRGWSRPS